MAEQAKFQKILEILLMLDCKYGRTIQEISERFDVSPSGYSGDIAPPIIGLK